MEGMEAEERGREREREDQAIRRDAEAAGQR